MQEIFKKKFRYPYRKQVIVLPKFHCCVLVQYINILIRGIIILYSLNPFNNINQFLLLITTLLCVFYSMQDVDLGFCVLVDRRGDKWGSVKTLLLRISVSLTYTCWPLLSLLS